MENNRSIPRWTRVLTYPYRTLPFFPLLLPFIDIAVQVVLEVKVEAVVAFAVATGVEVGIITYIVVIAPFPPDDDNVDVPPPPPPPYFLSYSLILSPTFLRIDISVSRFSAAASDFVATRYRPCRRSHQRVVSSSRLSEQSLSMSPWRSWWWCPPPHRLPIPISISVILILPSSPPHPISSSSWYHIASVSCLGIQYPSKNYYCYHRCQYRYHILVLFWKARTMTAMAGISSSSYR